MSGLAAIRDFQPDVVFLDIGLPAGAGLHGVEFVVRDDHAGLVQAIPEIWPEAAWQRCYVHFLRNTLDHPPRKADDDCLMELRWMYERRDVSEARRTWRPGGPAEQVAEPVSETL